MPVEVDSLVEKFEIVKPNRARFEMQSWDWTSF